MPSPKQVVVSAIEALTAGRYADYLEYLSEDVRFYTIGSTRYSGLVVGRAAVWEKILSRTTASIDAAGYREDIILIIGEGEYVAVQSRGYEKMRNGNDYNNEYACFYRVQNAKISEVSFYLDTDLIIESQK